MNRSDVYMHSYYIMKTVKKYRLGDGRERSKVGIGLKKFAGLETKYSTSAPQLYP